MHVRTCSVKEYLKALSSHASLCALAAELATANSAPSPAARSPALTLHLPAPHPSHGQALQEKPGLDQLPGTISGPGDGDSSKPRRAESRGRVEA